MEKKLEESPDLLFTGSNCTSGICFGDDELLSKARVLHRKEHEEFFKPYKLIPVDSFESFVGVKRLYEVLTDLVGIKE